MDILETRNLLESEQWRQFLESTATALHLDLLFRVEGKDDSSAALERCPDCGRRPAPDDPGWETGDGIQTIVLKDGCRVLVRSFPCCEGGGLSYLENVEIARRLIVSFFKILTDHWRGERLATELTTLHQINRIILSMFRGDHKALDHVIDLILSAAVILFDAGGSWLEYTVAGERHVIEKGVFDPQSARPEDTLRSDFMGPNLEGSLVILKPGDRETADSFLSFMAQECLIIFEIDSLLSAMDSKTSQILGNVDNLILLVDKDKSVSYANRAAATLLDRPVQDLIGLPVGDFEAPWRQSVLLGTSKNVKGVRDLLQVGNDYRRIDWDVYPLTYGEGIPGWLVMASDCTDACRIQALGERLEKIVNTASLLNVMAHEIRNPLATFKGLLQLIDSKTASPEIRQYAGIGLREVKRLSFILDEYMILGKSTASPKESVELRSFIEDILPLLRLEFCDGAFHIETRLEDVPPVKIERQQMTQVMINLIKNSCEAQNHRGKVTLGLARCGERYAELTVADCGPGLSKEIRDKVFTPYFTTKTGGSGLGLAITRDIIQNHGGEIKAGNSPDGGAAFSILLPLADTGAEGKPVGEVLLLTDDDLFGIPMQRVLSEENIHTTTSNLSGHIVSVIGRRKPSILLIDGRSLGVSELNGLLDTVCREYAELKIIAVGAELQPGENERVVPIPAPLNYAQLIHTVKSLLD